MTEEIKTEMEYRKEWLRKLWLLENKEVPEEQEEKKKELVFFMRKIAGSWTNPFGKAQKLYDDFSRVWHPELEFEEAFDIVKSAWSDWMKEAAHRADEGLRVYKDYPATINANLTEILHDGKAWWNDELKRMGIDER